MKRNDLFSTPVYSATLPVETALKEDILAWRTQDGTGNTRTNRGNSWHSKEALGRPSFGGFQASLIDLGSAVIRDQRMKGRNKVRLTSIWANVLEKGGYHVPHNHGTADWSGVFYVSAPEGSGFLRVYSPDGRSHAFDAKTGRIYLFPGNLLHSVDPHEGSKPRIAVSFNFNVLPSKRESFKVVPGVLTRAELKKLSSLLEDKTWSAGTTFGGKTDHRSNDVVFLNPKNDPKLRWLHERIVTTVMDTNPWGLDISGGPQTYQVSRYQAGQEYKAHIDSGGNGEAARRSLTCVIELKAAEKGGGTSFPNAPSQPETVPGDAVIFPADELHAGLPVEEGERTTLAVWFMKR